MQPPSSVNEVKADFVRMKQEKSLPKQKEAAAYACVTQSYVSKIFAGKFERLNKPIEDILEYSRLSPSDRQAKLSHRFKKARDIHAEIDRAIAQDPEIGRILLDLLVRIK